MRASGVPGGGFRNEEAPVARSPAARSSPRENGASGVGNSRQACPPPASSYPASLHPPLPLAAPRWRNHRRFREPAAAPYRKGEGDRVRTDQARPDGAVPRQCAPGHLAWGKPVGFPPQSDGGEKGPAPGLPVAGLVIPAKERGGAARRGSAPPDGVNRTRRAWLRRGRGPVRRCGKRGSGRGRLSAPATGSIAARNPDRRLPRRG